MMLGVALTGRLKVKRSIALLFLFLTALWTDTNYQVAIAANKTVLHFPDRSSLGELYVVSDQYPAGLYPGGPNSTKQPLVVGKASGLVSVPKTAKLLLQVGDGGAQHPSLLTTNGPSAFAGLDFGSVKPDGQTMEKIGELTGLQALQLDVSHLPEQALMPLGKLKNLEYLSLAETATIDRELQWLVPLGSLKYLVLKGTKISDTGLKNIQKCRRSLRTLGLDGTNISDNELPIIDKCENLQFLSITNSKSSITDAGLRSLTNLSELSDLRLNGNPRITAKGLLQLTGLKKLKTLRLRQTAITAKDLQIMKLLSQKMSLKTLVLEDGSFTSGEVKRWHQALPHVLTIAATAAVAKPSEEKILHFPDRTSLGQLQSIPYAKKTVEARGTVRVPKSTSLYLRVGYAAARDPSLLTAYGPDFFTGLDFSRVETDDTTVAKISALSGLRSLDLRDADLSEQGMKSVSKLKNLENLKLERTALTDQCTELLVPLRSLKRLSVDQTKITDDGLRNIQKCRKLRTLGLSQCHITDAGLRSVATLPELQELELSDNRGITAKGLLQLTDLKELKTLRLRQTVTAKDLQIIKMLSQKVPSLHYIEVKDRSFTSAAMWKWQQALPNIAVEVAQSQPLQKDAPKLFAPLHSWSDR